MRSFFRFATTLILFAVAGTLAAEPGTTPPWHFLSLDDVDAWYYVHYGYTSVALDDAGKVHVSYRGPGRVSKYISNRTGAWVPETVFNGQGVSVARENSLAIDSNGLPQISFSYSDGAAEDLKYARKLADGTWEVTTVFTTNSGGMENAIALDAGNKAHISHWQWNGSDLLYSTNVSGSWSTTTLDDANWDRTALKIDSHDQAHIVYKRGANLMHLQGGVFETIDSNVFGQSGPALAIDSQDGLHVTYSSGLSLKYATNRSGAWSVTTIASGADVGLHHAVAVDPQGHAHVSYRNGTQRALFYATNSTGSWSQAAVDSGPELGYSNSIAIGGGGRVAISYRYQTAPTYSFRGIWGSSPSNILIVGSGGGILRYDGASLVPMSSGTGTDLLAIWGTSPSAIFAVGQYGMILRYDGNQWTNQKFDTLNHLYGVWGSSASSVFAVGGQGTVLHHDGASWSALPFPVQKSLHAIWGSSDSDLFVAGADGSIFHYDGSVWSSMASGVLHDLWALWGSSSSDLFAVGDFGTILHYDGVQWTRMTSGTTRNLYGVWGDATGNVFAVGYAGTTLRFNGASWAPMAPPTGETLRAIWGQPSGDLFSAGYHQVFRSDRSSWTELTAAKLRIASNCILAPHGECLPPPSPASDYWTLPPCRVFDSRDPAGPSGGIPLGSGVEQPLALAGHCGIPSSALAVSINATVVNPAGSGYLQLYPADSGPFGTSTLNFSAGQARANNAVLRVGSDGTARIAVRPFVLGNGTVHVILDVNGYFAQAQDSVPAR